MWELAGHSDLMLRIESAKHQTLTARLTTRLNPPGLGAFSVESDRAKIGEVLQVLIRKRLVSYLKNGDWHGYRYLLNQQSVRLRGLPVEPVRGLVPPSDAKELANSLLGDFFHQNGFSRVEERDSAGWSPLCYAAAGGDPVLVQELLGRKANANDSIKKAKKDAQMPAGMKSLYIYIYIYIYISTSPEVTSQRHDI